MDCKVSVLVAVYNTAQYLKECLDSLINQSLKEIEIICIDDASTDNSLSILKEYEKKDNRIIVLTQEKNQGQAKARNKGLAIARGEYITMTDSDDWLSPDALEKAYQIAISSPNTDTVLFDLELYDEPTNTYTTFLYQAEKKVYSGEEALRLILEGKIHGIYLIHHSIHKKYPYDETSRMYSDDNIAKIHFLHSKEIHFSTGIYYYRRHVRSNTIIHNIRRFDRIEAAFSLKNLLKKENVHIEILKHQEKLAWLIVVDSYIYYLQYKSSFNQQEREEILKRIYSHIQLVDFDLLPSSLKYKFGYIPFKKSFSLFRIQLWLYNKLRSMRNKMTNQNIDSILF